jgi:hypothetical protein
MKPAAHHTTEARVNKHAHKEGSKIMKQVVGAGPMCKAHIAAASLAAAEAAVSSAAVALASQGRSAFGSCDELSLTIRSQPESITQQQHEQSCKLQEQHKQQRKLQLQLKSFHHDSPANSCTHLVGIKDNHLLPSPLQVSRLGMQPASPTALPPAQDFTQTTCDIAGQHIDAVPENDAAEASKVPSITDKRQDQPHWQLLHSHVIPFEYDQAALQHAIQRSPALLMAAQAKSRRFRAQRNHMHFSPRQPGLQLSLSPPCQLAVTLNGGCGVL